MPRGNSWVERALPLPAIGHELRGSKMTTKILLVGFFTLFLSLAALQAQPVVAPSPERPGLEQGRDVGLYNVTNSFEFGYRFTEIGGDSGLFRSNENFGNGLRLFGGSLDAK